MNSYCLDCATNRCDCYPDECPVKYPTMRLQPHVWTLPLSPGRWGYLQLPSRSVSEAEWEQMYAVLEAMKPGLLPERDT